ncbi:uncharacterized protein N7515_009017 [Penicillium bovifimosum]|uniref:MARVEL domain-containing protein n=1 Tax=Penicillium bovifimosum TaxID=126998 RepID=A0A9W9KU49_9EURO|nr:uncharacterized protein N7515_009017 [Penicillium bovifimosum]KAJ5121056.1 hypothetical protein N7515_009017 [Penicillium bovifimosum]
MGPNYGALGATFQIARLFQACSLIAIIGMTAKFISLMVTHNATPPNLLVGMISVTSIAVIYCLITAVLYLDDILPFLIIAILDTALLIALIVVTVLVGKPLSYLKCTSLAQLNDVDATIYAFASRLSSYIADMSGRIDYVSWIGASRAICLETKAIWGLSIALCILFFSSAICSVCLWQIKKKAVAAKSVE